MKFTLTFDIPDGPEAMSFHREPAAALLEQFRFGATDGAPSVDINDISFFVDKVTEAEGEIAVELRLLD